MKKLIKITGMGLLCIFGLFSLSFSQETITITTYYPSPYGSYKELETETLYFRETTNGLISFNYPDTTYDKRLRITAGKSDTQDNDQGASIDLHGNSNTGRLDLVAGRGGYISFWSSPAGTSAQERMRITSSGNVGIGTGTTTPGARLVVDAGNNLPTDGNGAIFQGLDTFSNFGISIFNPSTTGLRSNIIRFAYNNGTGNPVNVAYIRSQNVSTNAANGGRLIFETYQNNTGTLNGFLVIMDRDGTIDIGNPTLLTDNSINAARVRIAHNGVPLQFYETGTGRANINQGGLWRMPLDQGVLRFDVNTAAAGNFSSYTTPLSMNYLGNVGIGMFNASYPLQMGSGAYCSVGGTWTDASSREYKKDMRYLRQSEYRQILEQLNKIEVCYFHFKNDADNELRIGIIAEDAPEIIVDEDKKGLYTSDAIGFLIAAVKAQQDKITELERNIEILKNK